MTHMMVYVMIVDAFALAYVDAELAVHMMMIMTKTDVDLSRKTFY